MKDVNQYRNELVGKITAEVMQRLPELMCKKDGSVRDRVRRQNR